MLARWDKAWPSFGLGAAVCFALGTPPEVVAAFESTLWNSTAFQLIGRWSANATDGGCLSQGDPTVLTYSFVPDGTFISSLVPEPDGPSDLFATFDSEFGSTQAWQDLVHETFDCWSELVGITYMFEPNDDGTVLFAGARGILGVRGDVRISGHSIDGAGSILAYNTFPNSGTRSSKQTTTASSAIRLATSSICETHWPTSMGTVWACYTSAP